MYAFKSAFGSLTRASCDSQPLVHRGGAARTGTSSGITTVRHARARSGRLQGSPYLRRRKVIEPNREVLSWEFSIRPAASPRSSYRRSYALYREGLATTRSCWSCGPSGWMRRRAFYQAILFAERHLRLTFRARSAFSARERISISRRPRTGGTRTLKVANGTKSLSSGNRQSRSTSS